MRIMTSNIWGDFFNNPTALRERQIYHIYQKYEPDVIGFQEVAAGWYDVDLFKNLSEKYNLIGTECYNNTNSTPLVIKKEYKVIAYGHEQLADTPDWSKSITWAVAEKGDSRFAVCNTHFWWMRGTEAPHVQKACGVVGYTTEDHNALRAQNAAQLVRLMQHLQTQYACPVFAFGDMNTTVSEKTFEVYAENKVTPLYDMAEEKDTVCSVHGDPVRGEDGMFHGKKATAEYINWFRKVLLLPETEVEGYFSSIDHIVALGEGFRVTQYRVIEDQDALDATDHSPVYADVQLL